MPGVRIAHIQRGDPVRIWVNRRPVTAYRGETVFAALIASGDLILRRSQRLKDGRGGFCGMGVCYECLVCINGLSGQRACMVEVEEGMEIEINDAKGL
jgi:predicted molibdopterin-dependent oxidoreductase YjgC